MRVICTRMHIYMIHLSDRLIASQSDGMPAIHSGRIHSGHHLTEDNHDRNDESNRTSIWSVRTEDRFQFSVIFFTLLLAGLCLAAYYEIWVEDTDSLVETILALARDIGVVGLASVILALARFEGGDILGVALDIWKKKEFDKGLAEGRLRGQTPRARSAAPPRLEPRPSRQRPRTHEHRRQLSRIAATEDAR